ncbi:hypothetical protein [Fundidesulfovibrio terrae]|uniref:hypothetical protein n=1 Tax=Fundidesulfovibrio terrae TaxID=2922866 RepID=UPI001FAE8BFF|nr:hypothetical protein [Fundidesulfovibrio terrae]
MNTIQTKYGPIGPVDFVEKGPHGHVTSCVPMAPITITTPLGELIAQHSTDDMRRPKVEPIEFHPDGSLKSLALEERTAVPTPVGTIEAELVTFHPDGSLRRVFPLNGKLSGYWTEKEEVRLAGPLTVPTPVGTVTARLVNVQFFPSGKVRSLTLWPGDTVEIDTPIGRLSARIGLAFHKNGNLRSFEPARMTTVPTPLGDMEAFDPDAEGIHGDLNSLAFHEDGAVASLATPLNTLEITLPDGSKKFFAPATVPNLCDERVKDISPLRIFLRPGKISLGEDCVHSFPFAGHRFKVGRLLQDCFAPISYECGICG